MAQSIVKKIFTTLFILSLILMSFASADVIPPNSHSLGRCLNFVNLDDFPDIVLIGFYTGPMVDTYQAYKLENNVCLTKGYKFNSLNIYWTTKNEFESMNMDNLDLEIQEIESTSGYDNAGNPLSYYVYSPKNMKLLLEDVASYGGHISDNNPLVKENTEYSIANYFNNNLIIYISKKVSEYNNGNNPEIELFEKPLETPGVINTTTNSTDIIDIANSDTSVWHSIVSFFKNLFGGSR